MSKTISIKVSQSEKTLNFAALELCKYLRLMAGNQHAADVHTNSEQVQGIQLGSILLDVGCLPTKKWNVSFGKHCIRMNKRSRSLSAPSDCFVIT